MPKALLLENIHPLAAEALRKDGFDVETMTGALNEDELIDALDGVDLLGIRSKTTVTRKVLDARPELSAIGCFCIGTNQVDLGAAASKGVAVFNAPYSNTRSVVELVICDIICLMRRIPAHTHHMKHGVWDKSATGSHEVRGKTLGIIGYGNIGSQLSVLAEALGMRVVFYDLDEKLAMGNARRCETLTELLEQSDAVSIHVDGRKSNRGFFGEEQFAQMKPGAIFINASRGFIVDLDALKNHLDSGHIAGAAIDVFPEEPKSKGDPFITPLANEDNMILTPHIGGSTLEAQKNIAVFVAQRLVDYWFRGSTMLSVNLPQITVGACKSAARLCHLHQNFPGILAKVNQYLGEQDLNITAQSLGTEGEIGYAIVDVSGKPSRNTLDALEAIPGTIRLRVFERD
ncbi:phosphoglycerate dehydrogenase [Bifidobacterium gallicum]|uniref:D-3-phosphoglycerate dehydrogenase n=1 Tax=Bifidobacterium gallicum DSM 20093 = LMG 11596 TaxID=561180 RepID=D1NSV9_9BIFI|nr:phosphoglycerate dehydrogenase [Bifidobacterium gallicum]EFA23761.1 putative phosphoglycerate dehydrogenase [Bifidobacterium gallicum DSM 20093 = LMG 11596]KFI59225.1 3-phosphoglycerate dehydrogenase [Bifidobacterium gallicum DSM 20093 = LMG 11596]